MSDYLLITGWHTQIRFERDTMAVPATVVERLNSRMAKGDRRNQIVAVAMDLFASKGFNGTTTKEIAEAAGVSEAIIFRHFAKKKDLYSAIIDSKMQSS